MKRPIGLAVSMIALGALALAACAPGANSLIHTATARGAEAGFWLGLWHGIIAPVTFVISLFNRSLGIYELHNNGGWYNFGFILGVLSFHSNRAVRHARRRQMTQVTVISAPAT